jgi:serine/threonine protein kinase
VAIKVVDRSRNDTRSTRLLLREARIVAALTHPAICGVHEVGRVGGEPFIVMEFVEGARLSTMIRQECGLLLERALHYGIQVVDAVAHAYDHNVVHGDLKSSNIIVAPAGRVQILDRLPSPRGSRSIVRSSHDQSFRVSIGGRNRPVHGTRAAQRRVCGRAVGHLGSGRRVLRDACRLPGRFGAPTAYAVAAIITDRAWGRCRGVFRPLCANWYLAAS